MTDVRLNMAKVEAEAEAAVRPRRAHTARP